MRLNRRPCRLRYLWQGEQPRFRAFANKLINIRAQQAK